MSSAQPRRVEVREDFPLSEVPLENRKSLWSTSVVLLGFTFFTATMWGGGSLGVAFPFARLMWVIVIGNLLLGAYVAVLGYVAFKTGLNSVLLARFGFGDSGSKWPDFALGFTQIGWYAWGTATVAIIFVQLLEFSPRVTIPLMVFFGFAFCWTAYVGYRGLEKLSIVSVPAMLILILWSFGLSTREVGGLSGLLQAVPSETMTWGAAITIVFGTFVSGGTQATNWTRFARTARIAVLASLFAFFIGNGLMVFAGAYGAIVYQEADIVQVLTMQGLLAAGILMLFLNIWTTQDNTVYNFSVAGCNMLRTENRKRLTIIGAAIGTVLAILGMYDWLVPWLLLLGTFIPPIGGVIMADFFYKHKGRYPTLEKMKMKKFNYSGLAAYVIASIIAYTSPGVPPINGIIAAVVVYIIIDKILGAVGLSQDHEVIGEGAAS
ncbi:MAG: cytosine permease [Spirochaetaceae bacterium]|nr:MAG: cytosine permease [Spirochaetaceae bacterium]